MKRIFAAAALCVCAGVPARAQDAAPDTAVVYELADVESAPRAANAVEMREAMRASYPPALLAWGTAGRVVVSMVVGADGAVRAPRVLSSTDTAFDARTLAAVALLRFEPGVRAGVPVATRVRMPVGWQAPPRDTAEKGVDALDLSAVEVQPRLRNAPAIHQAMTRLYPADARAERARVMVQVRFRVDAEGMPGPYRVTSSTDRRFDQASIEAIGVARFVPARVNGHAVAVWVEMPLLWEL